MIPIFYFLDQQKQRPAVAAAANVTPLSTNPGENTSEVLIIEGYRDPTNGLWQFPLHHSAQNNKQANILEPHSCNHSRPMAPQHSREYRPTSQQDLAIFYHQIICCPTKRILIQAIKDGSFSTWPGLTEKLISKYLPESEITAKRHLDQ